MLVAAYRFCAWCVFQTHGDYRIRRTCLGSSVRCAGIRSGSSISANTCHDVQLDCRARDALRLD